VITTAEWGDQRLVRDGINGFIITRSPQALGKALERLPQIDPTTCRATVADYTATAMIDGYHQAYRQALAGHRIEQH
jgi:hypothetical protein